MFDSITHEVSGNPVTYLIVFLAAGSDVILPLVPSETIVVAAAVIAAQGGLAIEALVAAAAVGAFLGDNLVYWLGRRVGEPITARLFRGEKARGKLEWAEAAIRRRGPSLIVVGRFIPGGRTATSVGSGTAALRYRRFLLADAVAAAVWALYASLLGYLGGSQFEDNLWLPLLIAFAVASLVAVGAEAWRRASED